MKVHFVFQYWFNTATLYLNACTSQVFHWVIINNPNDID